MDEESTGRMLFGDAGLLFAYKQWGVYDRADLGVTFPLAFNQLFAVVPVWSGGGTEPSYAWTIANESSSGFSVYRQGGSIGVYYIAIGK
jgi:hypothetical protein